MEVTHAPAPDVQPNPPVEQTGGLLLQRKCACGGGSAGLTGHCGKCQEKRFTVQRYSRDRSLLHLVAGGLYPPGSLLPWGNAQVDVELPQSVRKQTAPPHHHNKRLRRFAEEREWLESDALNHDDSGSLSSASLGLTETEPAALTTTDSKATSTDIAGSYATANSQVPNSATTQEGTANNRATSDLIVEDSASELGPGQMRKGEFIDELRVAICEAADAELAAVGRSTAGCPYVDYWLSYYQGRSARHSEQALRRYAPEAANSTDARDYFPVVAQRVRQAVAGWAHTGEITGVPPEVSALVRNAMNGVGGIFAKAREGGLRDSGDPEQIQSQLGPGSALDSGVRFRMESAFGHDFSNVRVHSDSTAAAQSSRLNARAFTIGNHVAFGAGEYQPGGLIGDALLAHELAHVVQQGGAPSSAPLTKSESGYNELEEDADHAAIGAIASIWGGARGVAALASANAVPAMRSGLRLQRCKKETCEAGDKTVTVDLVKMRGSSRSPATDLAEVNKIYKTCCVQFSAGQTPTVPDAKSDSWLGGDTNLQWDDSCGGVHAEEKAMWDGATTEFKLSSRMRVFYVESITPSDAYAYSTPKFCAIGKEAPYVNHAVIPNDALTDTLAHEFGHILLNNGDHHGIDNPSDTRNLMFAPGRTASDLDASQCKIIYNTA